MSGFFNNCAESGAYKEPLFGKCGYLVNDIKYCDNLREVTEFTGIPRKTLVKNLSITTFFGVDGFSVKVVEKRHMAKNVSHGKDWQIRQRIALDGTPDKTEWRR